jgi:hypothetical protein
MHPVLMLFAVGLAMTVLPAGTSASVLCRTRTKTLVVRDTCKSREQVVTPQDQVDAGMQGPAGRPGPSGPDFRDLKVTDATGREVGVVTSLSGYYGAAVVVGSLAAPGSAGPEFWVFSVDGRGLAGQDSICSPDVQYFTSRDCTGDGFARCEYGACSPTSEFFARPLFAKDAATVCYPGDASEVRHGNFFRRARDVAPTPAQAAAICASSGGTLLGPAVPCGINPGFYCAPCCQPVSDVDVSPVHTFDASVVGTPPFRLSR